MGDIDPAKACNWEMLPPPFSPVGHANERSLSHSVTRTGMSLLRQSDGWLV